MRGSELLRGKRRIQARCGLGSLSFASEKGRLTPAAGLASDELLQRGARNSCVAGECASPAANAPRLAYRRRARLEPDPSKKSKTSWYELFQKPARGFRPETLDICFVVFQQAEKLDNSAAVYQSGADFVEP